MPAIMSALGALDCYLYTMNKLQKRVSRTISPTLDIFFESLARG